MKEATRPPPPSSGRRRHLRRSVGSAAFVRSKTCDQGAFSVEEQDRGAYDQGSGGDGREADPPPGRTADVSWGVLEVVDAYERPGRSEEQRGQEGVAAAEPDECKQPE